jgi:hypothetical protein
MVTSYNIEIFETDELQTSMDDEYNDAWQAAERAETWIKGAFESNSGHEATVGIAKDSEPDPGQEGPAGDSFDQGCICAENTYRCSYNNLFDWWGDWLQADCKDPHEDADDCRLLLTDYSRGGGLGAGDIAVACVGQDIAELDSSHHRWGGQSKHNAMDTVLEEIGHALINWDGDNNCSHSDDDGDGRGHDSGVIKYDTTESDYGVTPMGITGDRCNNNCADNSSLNTDYCFSMCDDDDDGNPDGWILEYSDCSFCGMVE